MAAHVKTRFGTEVVIRWVSGNVKCSVDSAAETTAFALTAESGLDIDELADGSLLITYQDSGGEPQRKYSHDNGATWGNT